MDSVRSRYRHRAGERISHYFKAYLPQQFDAVFNIDETRALEPIEVWSRDEADLPETYPSAL